MSCKRIFLKQRKWSRKYKSLLWLLLGCTTIFIVTLVILWLTMDRPNEFGDTAGSINGLFSALAFAGVVFAIFMQREELELQRREIKGQRAELKAQRLEFETQNETIKRQRFENTFFNMLQLQQQITDNISYSYECQEDVDTIGVDDVLFPPKLVKGSGREVFRDAFEVAIHRSHGKQFLGMRNLIAEYGIAGYNENFTPTYFDHYFRHLYRIFKYVSGSQLIKEDDRYEYASMARAQLSRYELIWLFYNGLSENGKEKFKPLIEQFSLLNNLREDILVYNDNGGVVSLKIPLSEYAGTAYSR